MINVSNAARRSIAESTRFFVKANVALQDGTELDIDGIDICDGGVEFSQGTSSTNAFDVGSAIIGTCTLTLSNRTQRFTEYDFTLGSFEVWIGIRLSNDTDELTIEWIPKGKFYIDEATMTLNTVTLKGLDGLMLLERPYSGVPTKYPNTVANIVRDICDVCDLRIANEDFPHADVMINKRPNDSNLTCLAAIGYIAQVCSCFARMTNTNMLELRWYDTHVFEGEDWLDGGMFDLNTPHITGDTADGGGFITYDGEVINGGEFSRTTYTVLNSLKSVNVSKDDIVITGIEVTASDDKSKNDGGTGEKGETYTAGTTGYLLHIKGNPFVECGKAQETAERLKADIVGMRFASMDVEALANPTIEAGDPIVVIDLYEKARRVYLTSTSWKIGNGQKFVCSAETPARNSASSFSAITKAIVEARESIRQEINNRQLEQDAINNKLNNFAGAYTTILGDEQTGYVYYLHDKPSLTESKYVWKMTADSFAISSDGGKTYAYGLDARGDAVLNRIYAKGLNADYITSGALTIEKNGKVLFKADNDLKEVSINSDIVIDSINESKRSLSIGENGIVILDDPSDPHSDRYEIGTEGILIGTWNEERKLYDYASIYYSKENHYMALDPAGDIGGVNINGGMLVLNKADPSMNIEERGSLGASNLSLTANKTLDIRNPMGKTTFENNEFILDANSTARYWAKDKSEFMTTANGMILDSDGVKLFAYSPKGYQSNITLETQNLYIWDRDDNGTPVYAKGWSGWVEMGGKHLDFVGGLLTNVRPV